MHHEHFTNDKSLSGDFFFQGRLHYASEVNLCVDHEELTTLHEYLINLALLNNGIHALQVFQNDAGEKLVFEDLLSGEEKDEMIEAGVSKAELEAYHKIQVSFIGEPALPKHESSQVKD